MSPLGINHIDFSGSLWYISSMLDLNSSLFWIFFMVWGLYLVLTRIFFKPVGKIIAEREARIAADAGRLQNMMNQVEIHTQTLETQMAQARKDAALIREEWSLKGEDVRTRSLAEAKEQATRVLNEKMAELENEVRSTEATLAKEVAGFSEKIKQAYL
jgi:F-type H+-transporting ATPase subunit b